MWISRQKYKYLEATVLDLRQRINQLETQNVIYGDKRNVTAVFPYDIRHYSTQDIFTVPELVTAILRHLKIKPQKVQIATDIVMVKIKQEKK